MTKDHTPEGLNSRGTFSPGLEALRKHLPVPSPSFWWLRQSLLFLACGRLALLSALVITWPSPWVSLSNFLIRTPPFLDEGPLYSIVFSS